MHNLSKEYLHYNKSIKKIYVLQYLYFILLVYEMFHDTVSQVVDLF